MSTEAQKRASEKYRLSHKDYYNKKSKEYAKRVRSQKNDYKARIDKAIKLMINYQNVDLNEHEKMIEFYRFIVDILKGQDIELDIIKALNEDLEDDIEMGG